MRNFYLYQIIIFAVIFFALPTFSVGATNYITKVDATIESNKEISIKFELQKSPKYRVFTIDNPDRFVVDIDDGNLVADVSNLNKNLFQSVRNSINGQGQVRVVFDLQHKAKVSKTSIIKSGNNKYYLLVSLTFKNNLPQEDKKYVITKQNSSPKPIIVIDSGHGGKDPGTVGKYLRSKEKFVTLGYSRELKRQLDKLGKFRVFLTRDQDFFIPLNERVAKARRLKADLFISIHADASPDSGTTGLSVYTLSEVSSDKQSELLASKENKSDIVGGADFSDESGEVLKILISLSQRSTMNESSKFAELVIQQMQFNKINVLEKPHRFAGFRVLTAPDVPSVLIELGYLSNKYEEKQLNSLSHKREVSKALANAVTNYFNKKQ